MLQYGFNGAIEAFPLQADCNMAEVQGRNMGYLGGGEACCLQSDSRELTAAAAN